MSLSKVIIIKRIMTDGQAPAGACAQAIVKVDEPMHIVCFILNIFVPGCGSVISAFLDKNGMNSNALISMDFIYMIEETRSRSESSAKQKRSRSEAGEKQERRRSEAGAKQERSRSSRAGAAEQKYCVEKELVRKRAKSALKSYFLVRNLY